MVLVRDNIYWHTWMKDRVNLVSKRDGASIKHAHQSYISPVLASPLFAQSRVMKNLIAHSQSIRCISA